MNAEMLGDDDMLLCRRTSDGTAPPDVLWSNLEVNDLHFIPHAGQIFSR